MMTSRTTVSSLKRLRVKLYIRSTPERKGEWSLFRVGVAMDVGGTGLDWMVPYVGMVTSSSSLVGVSTSLWGAGLNREEVSLGVVEGYLYLLPAQVV